jgi:hypothetical protein
MTCRSKNDEKRRMSPWQKEMKDQKETTAAVAARAARRFAASVLIRLRPSTTRMLQSCVVSSPRELRFSLAE